jgi:putative ATPase
MNMDTFEKHAENQQLHQVPLATRMRPRTLYGFIGQRHLVEKGRVIQRTIEFDRISPIIFWGPPGSGKTSLASIIAFSIGAHFAPISAVSANVADLREIITNATERYQSCSRRTILFVDDIHLLSKTLQDALLPFVNNKAVILIGATTENPSFEVNSPLLLRLRAIPLKPLTDEEIKTLIFRATADTLRGICALNVELEQNALEHLIKISNGNAQTALNTLELAALNTPADAKGIRVVNLETIADVFPNMSHG